MPSPSSPSPPPPQGGRGRRRSCSRVRAAEERRGPRRRRRTPALARIDLAGLGVTGAAGRRRAAARHRAAARTLALAGVGRTVDADALRAAAAVAVRRLAGCAHVALALPVEDDAALAAVLEGAALGAYAYTDVPGAQPRRAEGAGRHGSPSSAVDAAGRDGRRDRARDRRRRGHRARQGPREHAAERPAARRVLADRAVRGGGRTPARPSGVGRGRARARSGFGGILGVGAGSVRPPRLVRIGWAPEGAATHRRARRQGHHLRLRRPLAEAGRPSMVGMKYDMTGAATVLGGRRRRRPAPAADRGHRVALHRGEHAVRQRDPPGRRAAASAAAAPSRC